MQWMRILSVLMLTAVIAFGGAGCEKKSSDGPLENAGEAIDDAMEDAGDAIKDAAEDAKDAVKETAEDVKKKVSN